MGDNKLQAGKFLTCKTVGFKTALYGLSAICKELARNSLKSKKKAKKSRKMWRNMKCFNLKITVRFLCNQCNVI